MKCAFCHNSPDYQAKSVGFEIEMKLCRNCLSDNASLFTCWHSLSPLISVPVSVRDKWAHEILIDGLKTRFPKKEVAVSRAGKKGFASFFALECN